MNNIDLHGGFTLVPAEADDKWRVVDGEGHDQGYLVMEACRVERFVLALASNPGKVEGAGADEALEVARRWESWYESIVADFVGVTDRPSEPDRLHDWGWIDAHRPPPEKYSPAEPWAIRAPRTADEALRQARAEVWERAAKIAEYDRRSELAKKLGYVPKAQAVANDIAACLRAAAKAEEAQS